MRYNAKYKEPTVHKTMRIPLSKFRQITDAANENNTSFNFMVAYLVQEGLDAYNKGKD